MKHCLLVLLAVVLGAGAQAQRRLHVGPYAEGAVSFGELAEINKAGYGGGVQAGYTLSQHFSLQLAAGYLHFSSKDSHGYVKLGDMIMDMPYKNPNINALPVKLGLRYELPEKFYVQADAGAVFFLANHYTDDFANLHYNNKDFSLYSLKNRLNSGVGATLAPTVGLHVSTKTDVGLRYEYWRKDKTESFIALRASYSF